MPPCMVCVCVCAHTSEEKSSSGAASIALTVNLLLGCTVAKPPDTKNHTVDEEEEQRGKWRMGEWTHQTTSSRSQRSQ